MNYHLLAHRIITQLRAKIVSANANGVVLGLSGGIDSAVVAILCHRATKNTLCLILPCETAKDEIAAAKKFAQKFAIKSKIVDLTPVYRHLLKILPSGNRITYGNIKARLRMLTLYYFANKLNYLVVGTGNKSELMMGYFTKYGDGGVDILPLGGLYKTQVKALAQALKIPQEIINKTPTAGLWSGQSDEKELGISYDELDKILSQLEKGKKIKHKFIFIKQRIISTEHKRKLPQIFTI